MKIKMRESISHQGLRMQLTEGQVYELSDADGSSLIGAGWAEKYVEPKPSVKPEASVEPPKAEAEKPAKKPSKKVEEKTTEPVKPEAAVEPPKVEEVQ